MSTTALGYVDAHIYSEKHVTRCADKFLHEVVCAEVDDFWSVFKSMVALATSRQIYPV